MAEKWEKMAEKWILAPPGKRGKMGQKWSFSHFSAIFPGGAKIHFSAIFFPFRAGGPIWGLYRAIGIARQGQHSTTKTPRSYPCCIPMRSPKFQMMTSLADRMFEATALHSASSQGLLADAERLLFTSTPETRGFQTVQLVFELVFFFLSFFNFILDWGLHLRKENCAFTTAASIPCPSFP